jgi:DDRGK domain-containing protein 1
MLSLIVTITVFILLIILIYFFLRKLSGVEKDTENEQSQQSTTQSTINRSSRNTEDYSIRTESNALINRSDDQNYQSTNTTNNISTTYDPSKPLTKKQQYKMEKKKAKDDNREYQKMLLDEKKLREQEREREYLEKEQKREEERRREEEIIRKLKEDQEKKENEIYDQWKDHFAIAEEGEEVADMNNEDLIQNFVNYIKLRKVVSLEDLSGVFKVNPNDLVERLKVLESQGKIAGIVDDRGKYIYMTEKELAAIEKIFMQRGRISKAELIKECNKIIRFTPTEEDKQKILEEQNKAWKSLEDELGNNQEKAK